MLLNGPVAYQRLGLISNLSFVHLPCAGFRTQRFFCTCLKMKRILLILLANILLVESRMFLDLADDEGESNSLPRQSRKVGLNHLHKTEVRLTSFSTM